MKNDTNTVNRLARRISANRQGALDLNAFLARMVPPGVNDDVLDLGCGTGNQVIHLAPKVRSVVALDISDDLLKTLSQNLGDQANVELIAGSMDDAPDLLAGRRFDIVEAIYSLYYSRDIKGLVGRIARDLMAPGGKFLTISPDFGNNAEWYEDLGRVFSVPAETLATSLISRQILDHVLGEFEDVRCVRFINGIRYDDLGSLMSYFDGCGAYCPAEKRSAAEAYFSERFASDGHYTITKRALAIVGGRFHPGGSPIRIR